MANIYLRAQGGKSNSELVMNKNYKAKKRKQTGKKELTQNVINDLKVFTLGGSKKAAVFFQCADN